MPWRRSGWDFLTSDRRRDVRKPCSAQTRRRTAARVSAKVGRGLRYQAAVQTAERARWSRRAASNATIENSPSRQGVVRATARSDHWRWVSTPRWSRTSRKVTSTCQRWTNQRTICSGSPAGSGARTAGGARGGPLLPARAEPGGDLQRLPGGIGAEQRLWVEAVQGIAQQPPTNGQDG